MNFLKRAYQRIHGFFVGFMFGIKNTESEVLTQIGGSHSADAHISQEVNNNSLAKALLNGEVTQQVEELRYRTYKVDREAKRYEYFSPTLALKRDKNDSKFVKYENSDNLNVITIQSNEQIVESVGEALRNFGKDDGRQIYKEPLKKYIINISRPYVARYRLEEFTRRLVVRELVKGKRAVLDFYVTKYPDTDVFISKSFISEVLKVMNGDTRSDMLDIEKVHFVTSHAYLKDDMLEYEFGNISYDSVTEYDGNYILRFKADIVKDGIDLTDRFYNKEMDDKYRSKEKKCIVLDFNPQKETYICARCGKEITYDTDEVDMLMPKVADYADDSDGKEKTNATEYMDIQITEQTYGVRLCNDCLSKYLDEINQLK